MTAGSLPSLGPLAGISATTLTDKLKYGDLHEFGAMLSPLHFLDSLGKRSLMIKAEVRFPVSVVAVCLYLLKTRPLWETETYISVCMHVKYSHWQHKQMFSE